MPQSTSALGSSGIDDLWHGSLSEHRLKQSEHIAHAAMGVISREGIAGLSMSAIADEAGVSRQTLYKYFADVDAVLVGLTELTSATDAELAGRIESEADPRDGLHIFISTVLAAAAAGHPSPLAMMSALPPDARAALHAHESRAESLVIELLRRGCGSGTFRADLDPELDGQIVYRAILGAYDLAAGGGVTLERLQEHVASDVLHMLETG